jgi:hypothetical protein
LAFLEFQSPSFLPDSLGDPLRPSKILREVWGTTEVRPVKPSRLNSKQRNLTGKAKLALSQFEFSNSEPEL